jgi:hypothetical protein
MGPNPATALHDSTLEGSRRAFMFMPPVCLPAIDISVTLTVLVLMAALHLVNWLRDSGGIC